MFGVDPGYVFGSGASGASIIYIWCDVSTLVPVWDPGLPGLLTTPGLPCAVIPGLDFSFFFFVFFFCFFFFVHVRALCAS